MSAAKELIQSYHDLAVLLEAGLPIVRSLGIATDNAQGPLKKTWGRIRESVSDGEALAPSMREQRRTFADFDIMMVEAAERSGNLDACLKMLSEWYEFVVRIKSRILAGLILPIAMLLICAFVAPLPGFILGGLHVWDYLRSVVAILAIVAVPMGIIAALYLLGPKRGMLRAIMDALTLKIPILGKALWETGICRYARSFSMLYRAGLPMNECVVRAPQVTGNVIVGKLFEGAAASVKAGNLACEGFSDRVPAEYCDLWKIGEEVGELDKTVDKIAEIAADRADLYFHAVARWFPRFFYGFVTAIIIWQIFKLASTYGQNISRGL